MKKSSQRLVTRRRVLALAGAGVTTLAAQRFAPVAVAQGSGRIDVHHHWHPPVIRNAYQGVAIGSSWPGGEWRVDTALRLMDRFDIRTGLLSVRNPRARVTVDQCRAINEAAAEIVADHPSRFGALAYLPQYDFDAVVAEAVHALDVLGLDGVGLNPSIDNVYLGAPEYEPLMVELGRRNAAVLLHPTAPPFFNELGLSIRSSVIEYVFETTRAIANLILSGTIERHPGIRWITAHAGGAAPYIAARLDDQAVRFDPAVLERAPDGVIAYMKTLYYGTAQATSLYSLRALTELVDSSRIVFGTDLPISPPSLIEESDRVLADFDGFTAADLEAIESGNARELFPRLG
ncbi:MAG TPA: amidohydrolase family protein [Gammaproteobacteria bacterium]